MHQRLGRVRAMRHPRRKLGHRHRIGRGEEDGLHHPLLLAHRRRREQALSLVLDLAHVGFRLMAMGAKVSPCLSSIWPCLASSSEAAKVAAVAERRRAGSADQPSGR